MENSEQKKEVIKKVYKIEVIVYDDRTYEVNRTNNGFSAMELLGMLSQAQDDILVSIRNNSRKIDATKRSSENSPFVHDEDKAH